MMTMMIIVLRKTLKYIIHLAAWKGRYQAPLLTAENENAHLEMPRREQKVSHSGYVWKEGVCVKVGKGLPLCKRGLKDLSEGVHC